MTDTTSYPVRVEASLDPGLSRWLWLVKWLLAIPHWLVLGLLWIAFAVLTLVAFFAILITGRYPRSLFDFNVGVLRWTWRVSYYAYGTLGTDRYPPFTLAEVPDYPAHLHVDRPEQLSRGPVLVKTWLLAIPHYLVTGFFLGGTWFAWRSGDDGTGTGGGLIMVLALFAAVVLLFTGRYPRSIFDFLLGMNRWVLRVAAYAGLMTDAYPPFRLDQGGREPRAVTLGKGPGEADPRPGPAGGEREGEAEQGAGGRLPPPSGSPARRHTSGWSAGRVVSVVAGSVLALISFALLAGGGTLLWADRTQRQDGYLTSDTTTLSTGGYALATDSLEPDTGSPDWATSVLGDVRIRITTVGSDKAVFLGVAPEDQAQNYLSGVRHTTVTGFTDSSALSTQYSGGAPRTRPAAARIWDVQTAGRGTRTVVWPAEDGRWTIVAMNADATPGLRVTADIGATVPSLPWIITGLLAGGVLLLAAGAVLIAVPATRASR